MSGDGSDDKLLVDFATGHGIVPRMHAARVLMARKRLSAVSSTPSFWDGIAAVAAICQQSESSRDRLLAAELLVRLSKALKSHRDRIVNELRPALSFPLPDLREMPAPVELGKTFKASEARENVALALGYVDYPWVAHYRLKALVQEDRSDDVRNILTGQMFAAGTSLEEILDGIATAIKKNTGEVDSPTAAARRTRELLAAISFGIRSSSLDGTGGVGLSLARLAGILLTRTGLPRQTKLIEECINALASAVDALLRTRVHLIIDGQSYLPLRLVSAWWGSSPFSEAVRSSLSPIVRHLEGAMLLLARMSLRSDNLVNALSIVLGGGAASAAYLRELEQRHPEIDPVIRQWMRAGGRDADQGAIHGLDRLQETVSRELDGVLANLLRSAQVIEERLAAAPSNADSRGVTLAASDIAQITQLLRDIGDVGVVRALVFEGKTGDVVDYSPSMHETSERATPREPKVRILRPAVVRKSNDSVLGILLKAIVTET